MKEGTRHDEAIKARMSMLAKERVRAGFVPFQRVYNWSDSVRDEEYMRRLREGDKDV